MGFSSSDPGRPGFFRPQADINVTPLVDVMLVLLIIFMVTAPLLAAGMKVELPQAKAAQPLNPKEPIVVIVGKDGKLAIGPDSVEAADLVQLVRTKMGGDASRVVHLRGDKEVAYGEVMAVMDQLATNGITHIAMVTESKKSSAPSQPLPSPVAPEPAK
ncbi:MAG: ExbD/TolR family protein [Rhodoblastus sp.]|uniref:ExbD/TolR family protein n=1 Tax=Rhodoblastus sp. TaxID=1962975 RepID=UPI003F9AD978